MNQGAARRIRRIVAVLEDAYGPRPPRRWGPALDGLIETILSQHTNDANSGAAFESLRAAFPSWDAVRLAPAGAIERAIRIAGLSRQKSLCIKRLLEAIHRERGNLSLEFLRDWPPAEARAWLQGFNGVGPKTAACVLLFNLGLPILPVDTHIHRLSGRLGLIGPRVTAEAAHALLQAQVPNDLVYSFHVLMIEHGRHTCLARKPACHRCALRRMCRYSRRGRGIM